MDRVCVLVTLSVVYSVQQLLILVKGGTEIQAIDHCVSEGKLSRLCSVQYYVQQLCTVQCRHMNRPNSSLDWVLSQWAHFTVLRFIFVYVCILCITVYCMF